MHPLRQMQGRRELFGLSGRGTGQRPLRVLLTEGASTSAREAVTALGLAGHHVEVCDPGLAGLARFSRFVRAYHRCPGLRRDPLGFVAFIERLLERDFDVLLPIHEQGMALAGLSPRLQGRVGLALPSFENYRRAHSKTGFSEILTELGLQQPATTVVRTMAELQAVIALPCVIKTAIGTASRGVWLVRGAAERDAALRDLAGGEWPGEVLMQALIVGATEKAQAVFCRGELVGCHAYRQIMEGAGGGDAVKRSVVRDGVCRDLAAIGRHLDWHGALSVDYIMQDGGGGPLYIDCNPRLVEPMAAKIAGIDLVDLLLRVSLGEIPKPPPSGQAGAVTHQAMQGLLGCALRGGTRPELFRLCLQIAGRRGVFAGSTEELTPVRIDWISALPLAATALIVMADPSRARQLASRGWGAHLLDARSIEIIAAARSLAAMPD